MDLILSYRSFVKLVICNRVIMRTTDRRLLLKCFALCGHNTRWFACYVEIFLDDQDKVASTVADLFN